MKTALKKRHRILLTFLGCICIILGIIGAILPVIPTTPFILYAAWCFARSNQHLYDWLLNHKLFGIHIRNWAEGKPIPRKSFIGIITFLWLGLVISALLTLTAWIAGLLLTTGIGVTTFLWTKSEYCKKIPVTKQGNNKDIPLKNRA